MPTSKKTPTPSTQEHPEKQDKNVPVQIETEGANIRVRLISVEYERKLNLENISRKRPYESASTKVSMYVDIPWEEQGKPDILATREAELQKLVKSRSTEILRETVDAVLAADNSIKYSMIAIEAAVDKLINSFVGLDTTEGEQAKAAFIEQVKTEQGLLSSQ